ncbi:hypothetical protein SAMN04488523_110191 [Sulfitobacter brevis]|uniref:Uncharacterized protein n=1 Tax=Sulfitobacter brevis TaxID=74348 RepID=A0A1I2DKM2_9RHOB|nr:hypothetical protein SAMN04488523_110191 [Sulfitobacter brevis]
MNRRLYRVSATMWKLSAQTTERSSAEPEAGQGGAIKVRQFSHS